MGLRRTDDGSTRPKVVSHYLLEKMQRAGARKAFFILRKGKWDIPEYYGNGGSLGIDLGYLIMGKTYGAPYTLDQAYPFVRTARIVFGFPDILFGPPDAFGRALRRLSNTKADIVMGLFRAHDIRIADMVAVDQAGQVRELVIKPLDTKLKYDWVFAVWTQTFTEFLHEYLAEPRTAGESPNAALPAELTMGHVIQAAIREGIRTQSVVFPRHAYLDIGTPEGLRKVAAGLRSAAKV